MVYLQTNSYNIDVAKVYGVRSSVFLSFLFKRLSESGENQVAIERDTIYNCTGLDENEQKDIEKALSDIRVVTVTKVRGSDTKNYYLFNEEVFMHIQSSSSTTLIPDDDYRSTIATKQIKQNRATKREILIRQLKGSLKDKVDSEIIRQSMCDWIDSVFANPKGFMSSQSLSISVNELLSFSENEDILLDIMNIAIKGGLRDLTWAINKYEQTHRESSDDCFRPYSETKSSIHTENGAF